MCGRFTLKTPPAELVEIFSLLREPDLQPRYNIAPTQPVATVRQRPTDGTRELVLMHWGLIPSWSKDPRMGTRMINARAETVATKPAFRGAFKRRRCLVLADGFYEWKKLGQTKQPYYIRRNDARPFAFAGLWERWSDSQSHAREIESCTIITRPAEGPLREIHDRMPLILHPADVHDWLDPDLPEDRLGPLLAPARVAPMEMYPVSRRVNSPRHDAPDCIEAIDDRPDSHSPGERTLFDH